MHLGNNIQKTRKLCKETQKEFAFRMGVTEPMQKTYESNKSRPDIIYLEKLVKLTGIPQSRLINEAIDIEAFKVPKALKVTNEPNKEVENIPDAQFLAGQLSMAERLIAKLESDHADAKADKEKLFIALTETRQTINELLKPMVSSLKEIPPVLDLIVRNSNEHDKEIMKALDHLVGNSPGTLAKESGKHILKSALANRKTGKKDGAHRQD